MGLAAGISKVWSSKAPTLNCMLNSRFTKLRRGWGKGPYGSSSTFLSYREGVGVVSRARATLESLCPEWQDLNQKAGHLTLGALLSQWHHSLALPVTPPAIPSLVPEAPGPPTPASSVFGQHRNSNPSSKRPYIYLDTQLCEQTMNWLYRISSLIPKLFPPQGLCADCFLFFGVHFSPQIF